MSPDDPPAPAHRHYRALLTAITESACDPACGLHPALGEAARKHRAWSVSLDLLGASPYVPDFPATAELLQATALVVAIFRDRAVEGGIELARLRRARLQFVFPPGGHGFAFKVRGELLLDDGREYDHALERTGGGT